MLELMIAVTILAIIAGTAIPNIARYSRRARVDRAAYQVAVDVQNAFSLAARQRKPIRVTLPSGTTTYTISDRATSSAIVSRALGTGSDYSLTLVSFAPATVDIFPNGTSTASLTVTLTSSDYTRTVTVSSAGFARVVPLS